MKSRPDSPLRIGGEVIPPGERRRIELHAASFAIGSPLTIPVEILHGRKPGPRLWLTAAIHGDELNGVEIIRQVLSTTSPRRLVGTLIAVPVVNGYGFITQSRYLPDRRDLNRSFPGSTRGSLAARVARLLMREVVEGSHFGIDLHTGSGDRTNLPQIRANLEDPETLRLARAFGAGINIHATVRDGSLRAAATAIGNRVLVFEGGEARRFNRVAVNAGTRGVLRVLGALGMRNESPESVPTPPESRSSAWVRAGRSGLARLSVNPGDAVEKGDPLGVISDAYGERILRVKARMTGIVIGVSRQPMVNRGDALVHIAEVLSPGSLPPGGSEANGS